MLLSKMPSEGELRSATAPDFISRRRIPGAFMFASIFFATLIVVALLVFVIKNLLLLVFLITVIIGVAAWYATFTLQRQQDLLLATEFQNALFSSAIGISHKFCLIIKQDGVITYLDRPFQDMFPAFMQQPQRTLDALLDQAKVAREEREEILTAVESGGFSRIICVMRTSGDGYYKLVLSVEPIVRPHGFILLRGREFVENRSSDNAPGVFQKFDQLNRSFISLFSQVVSTMNMGVMMTGPAGNILYANTVIERWLGFADGEIVSCGFNLSNIIQLDRDAKDYVELMDREVPVQMQMKHGGIVRMFLSQRVIHDDQNKLLGCVALLHALSSTTITPNSVSSDA
ncbi:MAG: hypothetical protein EBR02_08915 [Alphaproteobacteria bacterium]|nr:hypothetical protein [Alphaproteobacteria bacterium]